MVSRMRSATSRSARQSETPCAPGFGWGPFSLRRFHQGAALFCVRESPGRQAQLPAVYCDSVKILFKERMQVQIMTTHAAWQVLQILNNAGRQPRQDFHFDGPSLPDPPFLLTLHVALQPDIIHQLQNIPDLYFMDTD
jgi:hypothetical protein